MYILNSKQSTEIFWSFASKYYYWDYNFTACHVKYSYNLFMSVIFPMIWQPDIYIYITKSVVCVFFPTRLSPLLTGMSYTSIFILLQVFYMNSELFSRLIGLSKFNQELIFPARFINTCEFNPLRSKCQI